MYMIHDMYTHGEPFFLNEMKFWFSEINFLNVSVCEKKVNIFFHHQDFMATNLVFALITGN